MKTKDFGFFQQHTEKLALGLGAVVILGVVATQFLMGEPNAIELNNQKVAPAAIKDTVVKDYKTLEQNLTRDSYVDLIEIPQYAESYRRLYERPVASDTMLGPFDVGGLATNWLRVESPEYPRKFLPSPPVTVETLAKSGHGVLQSTNDPRFPQIRSMIGDQEPADFSYVSVSAFFSFKDWTDRLKAENVSAAQRIDPGLWQPRLLITSVQLLREEQDPLTGEWGSPTTIAPLPGQFAILPDDTRPRELEDAQQMEQWLNENQPDFRRAPFPEISNGTWTPPDQSNRVFTSEELARQRDLESDIRRLQRQLDNLTGNDQRGADGRRDRPGQRERQTGGDEYDGGGGGYEDGGRSNRGNRNNDRSSERDNDRAAQAREREAERIRLIEDDLFKARSELNELMGVEDELPQPGQGRGAEDYGDYGAPDGVPNRGNPEGYGNPGGYGNPEDYGSQRSVAGQVPDRVKVWAHDLTAQPGKTYRYKVVVSVMNPLYRFPRLNEAQREDNFHRVAIPHDETELTAANWSAPLTLDPKYYFFALSGSKDQKRANFEVWTVYDGQWRNGEFTEYPGNEIGGEGETENGGQWFKMSVGSIMLDVDSVPAPSGRGSVVRVLYLDPDTGRIDYRLVNDDKNSDDKQRLENEQQRQLDQENSRVSSNTQRN